MSRYDWSSDRSDGETRQRVEDLVNCGSNCAAHRSRRVRAVRVSTTRQRMKKLLANWIDEERDSQGVAEFVIEGDSLTAVSRLGL